MRLLIALPDQDKAQEIMQRLDQEVEWDFFIASDGTEVLRQLEQGLFDLLLLHACLPSMDGISVGRKIEAMRLVCPPRILLLCPMEYLKNRPRWADCIAAPQVTVSRLCVLVKMLIQKPLPALAAVNRLSVSASVQFFLDRIGLNAHLKGRTYTAWMLMRLIPSPLLESQPIGLLYQSCADAFSVSSASVERCMRVAVESVFTQGNIHAIDQYFGATADPERGKPTNRAFLLQAAQQLRFSITP